LSAPVNPEASVREAFAVQAGHCERLGSPFTALLCRVLAEQLDQTTSVGRRILGWPNDPGPSQDALALRVAGGLHALVRRGELPDLSRFYPPNPMPDPAVLGAAVAVAFEKQGETLSPWLDGPPQTNETARSAILMAGYAVIAARTGLPLELLELGASAGLNLQPDRYDCRLGRRRYGDPGSAVRLAPAWSGGDPPEADVRIAARRGVDESPLDPAKPADRERLLAYIWPDQPERLARMSAALDLAAADPPRVDAADAADWLEARLSETPSTGVVRTVAHSIAFQYFPHETQGRIAAAMMRHGQDARADRPLAWLRFEADAEFGGRGSLRLRLWPGGEDEVLALADHHVRAVEWRP
jgi:hypothetical protein